MATLFTTTVASAKPAGKDYKLSDGAGLYLLVRPNGSKLWRFNYVHHGKHRTLAFGAWPDVGLADARGKRDEARRLIAAGLDPSHEEKVARAKARVEEHDTFKAVAKERATVHLGHQPLRGGSAGLHARRVLERARDDDAVVVRRTRPPA